MGTTVKNIPYARDDFWSRIPDDCKKAISELKRMKVHGLCAYDYEDTFADVWWLVLHEVDMWDEGEYRMEADANESDPCYMNRKQANTARKWLVKWESLFIKYAKESDKWADPEHIRYQKNPA